MMHWTFKAVAVPKLLYASHVWHQETFRKTMQQKLTSLSRLALLNLAPSRLKTPTAGLQIILGSIPLHHIARERNVRTNHSPPQPTGDTWKTFSTFTHHWDSLTSPSTTSHHEKPHLYTSEPSSTRKQRWNFRPTHTANGGLTEGPRPNLRPPTTY